MKWLTLNEIKDQLRIERDFDLEDDKLTGYGESAEDVILELCQRTYDDFIDNYGGIPGLDAADVQQPCLRHAGEALHATGIK